MSSYELITVGKIESIAFRVFEENFPKLQGEAAKIANDRANAFTRSAISALAKNDPNSLEKIGDPAFLQSLYVAQRHAATTGALDLQAVLIQLLVSLSRAGSRSLQEVCISDAIEKAGKTTSEQLTILALVFVITKVRWEKYYKNQDANKFINEMIEPFCDDGAMDLRNYSHLDLLGCIEIGPYMQNLDMFFVKHFRTLFSKGIPREDFLRSIDDSDQYLPLFEDFNDDKSKMRFRYQTEESIDKAAVDLGLPGSWVSTIQIDDRYMMTAPEKFELLKTLNPAVEKLQSIWVAQNSRLSRCALTMTGIAMAHSYLASLGRACAPIEQWLD